jgi:Tfp pilus assembly protein PilX
MIDNRSSERVAIGSIYRRLAAIRDERGVALMSVMLFMILLAGMSLVLLSVILGQVGPSYLAAKGTKTVYAAQAGLQSALGVVRSASAAPDAAGNVFGDPAKLPCTFTGSLDPVKPDVGYSVTLQYYVEDPTNKIEPWLSANDLTCTTLASGQPGGVRNASNVLTSPEYAYIVSRGTGSSAAGRGAAEGNRAVAAVYKFKVRNINVPGGRIYAPPSNECMEAQQVSGSAAIGVGSKIKFVTQCTADGGARDAKQLWVYASSYQIKLASSTDGVTPGLCITGVPTNPVSDATLQTCKTGNDRYTQLWSWTGAKTWQGQQSNIAAGNSESYLSQSGSGSNLKVSGSFVNTFIPSPAVGAGNAGKETKQIVNYKEFGRCLDVTGARIGDPFMIAYPCKQDPSGTGNPAGTGKLDWNHKWWYTETSTTASNQQIFVYTSYDGSGNGVSSTRRCLETPTGSSKYPTFKPCTAGLADPAKNEQSWTRVYEAADYGSSYLIKDINGRCLTANSADLYDDASGNKWSKITVGTCTVNENQKWNAPPNDALATFSGFRELG